MKNKTPARALSHFPGGVQKAQPARPFEVKEMRPRVSAPALVRLGTSTYRTA